MQRKLVIEEFKQLPQSAIWRCVAKLRPLAYQVHPYRWATMKPKISHIENATMEDVRQFFFKYYLPNATLVVIKAM
ncbi:MAG: hypothetical protein R2822_14025 [Spirosomataceae bacterium]